MNKDNDPINQEEIVSKLKIKKVKKRPKALKNIKGELFSLPKSKKKKKEDYFKPDAIFVDGGKGQLSSAKKVLDKLGINIPLFSIAKKEEEIFTYQGNEIKKIDLNKNSEELFLVQRLRDESHRFAISYNKNLRDKSLVRSAFDDIKGIGPATKKRLIRAFGSASGVRQASDQELLNFVNEKILKKIRENL